MKKLFSALLCLFLLVLPFSALAEGLEIEVEPLEEYAPELEEFLIGSELLLENSPMRQDSEEITGYSSDYEEELSIAAADDNGDFNGITQVSEIDYTPDDDGVIAQPRPYVSGFEIGMFGALSNISFGFGVQFGLAPYEYSANLLLDGEMIFTGTATANGNGETFKLNYTHSPLKPGSYSAAVVVTDANGSQIMTYYNNGLVVDADGGITTLNMTSSELDIVTQLDLEGPSQLCLGTTHFVDRSYAKSLYGFEAPNIKWTSDNPSIVTVDQEGNVYGASTGKATIRAMAMDGSRVAASLDITVAEHVPESIPGTEASCTETGMTEGSCCSVCNEILVAQEVVPALGHTEEIDVAVAATCTETGLTEGKHCSVCNEVLVAQEIVPALGHTEVIDAAVEATCTETGLTEGKHCSVCGEILLAQEQIPAVGHTPEVMPAVEATTTSTGLTEGSKCSVCGTVLKAQEVIPMLTAEQPSVEPQPTEQTSTDPAVPTETAAPANPEPTAPPVAPVPGDYVDTTGKFIINADLTATYNGPAKAVSKVKTATIPDEISVGGISVKVTAIADKAFYKASKLTKVSIGANVKTIGKSAFASCAKLKTVSGGSGIVTIGASAFKGDKVLTKITLGKKLTTIGKSAFNGCKKLKTVTIKSSKLKKVGSSAFKGVSSSVTFKCPSKKLKAYKKLIKKAGAPSKAKYKK